jgi:ubiquinone/menaquinone biosynthesis C-methylase UbiE
MSDSLPQIVRHMQSGETCCDPEWEAAYERFETREQEIRKFVRRLRRFGLHRLPADRRIVELFCGRGSGLVALERLGHTKIEGVDLSETLLRQYRGVARLHLADCRQLPFADHELDAVIVQGGLHHLPRLPEDLAAVLAEVGRVLRTGGTFYVVEPWLTPFLRLVHAAVRQPLLRRLNRKGDALATMIEHERQTYEQWLTRPGEILDVFRRYFVLGRTSFAWGKLTLTATPSGTPAREGRSLSSNASDRLERQSERGRHG